MEVNGEILMRLCELKNCEVINVRNCKRLGCVADVDIDICCGRVLAIIVPVPGKFFFCLGREKEYVIRWCDIKQVGCDIILVDVDEEKCLVKCE